MKSQLETLINLSPSKLEHRLDLIDSGSAYSLLRLRVHSPELARAYHLLYPRDYRQIGSAVLEVAGLAGMAALWSDCGSRLGRRYRLICPSWHTDDWHALLEWLDGRGYPATPRVSPTDSTRWIGLNLGRSRDSMIVPDLLEDVIPLLHSECRGALSREAIVSLAP